MKIYIAKNTIELPNAIVVENFDNIKEDAIFITQPCLLKSSYLEKIKSLTEEYKYAKIISLCGDTENITPIKDDNAIYETCYFKRYGPTDGQKYKVSLAHDLTQLYISGASKEMPKYINKKLAISNITVFVSNSLEKRDRYKEIIELIDESDKKEQCYTILAYHFNNNHDSAMTFYKFCDLKKLYDYNFRNAYIIFDSFCISAFYKDKSKLPEILPYLLCVPIYSNITKNNLKFYLPTMNLPSLENFKVYFYDLISSKHHSQVEKWWLDKIIMPKVKENNKIGIHWSTDNYIPSIKYYQNCFSFLNGEYIVLTNNIEKAKNFFKEFKENIIYSEDYKDFFACQFYIASSSFLPFITGKEVIAPLTQKFPLPCKYVEDPYYISIVSEDINIIEEQSWKYYEVVKSLEDCKYDIVAFHKKGDVWDKEKLEKQINIYSRGKYDIVGTFIDEKGKDKPTGEDFLKNNVVYKGSIMLNKNLAYLAIDDLNIKGYSFYNIPEILVNSKSIEVKEDVKDKYKNGVTIVTAFYRVNTGKYPKNYYNNWIANFLTLDCNTVAFISKEDKMTQELIDKSGKKNIIVIYKEMEEFHNKKYYENYKWQNTIDGEKHLHYPEMYMIWNEKPFFVLEAVRLDPFKSEWFAWTDFGSCRSPEHAKQVKTFGNVFRFMDDDVDKSKICFLAIQSLSDKEKELNENNIPKVLANINENRSCDEIARYQGTFFKGRKDLWEKFCRLYDEEIQHFIKYKTYCGKEQNIMISLAIKYPQYITWRYVSKRYHNPYFAFYNDHC